VVVCLPVAEAQAARASRAVAGEVAHLLTHGLLHILGYDHEDTADAATMQAREDALLAALGYAGQYEHGDH
jgi:probable rRNA maturation factor